MIPDELGLSLGNTLSWMAQAVVLASLAAVLPVMCRLRHPRSHLAYCHAVLAACLLLPLIQPWEHPVVFISNSFSTSPASSDTSMSWSGIALALLATGAVARLGWIAIGLWQIRQYRSTSTPLGGIPESIRTARILASSDAMFRVSTSVHSPAALGYVNPIVLLPQSFLSLDEDAQRAIACHELLHVRRNDWLVTVAEEVVGALFWFNPGIWWLLSQARLSREQLVDAEVVRLTMSPAPYINALLSIAGAPTGLKVAPAALFFTKGHLAERMKSLLADSGTSRWRLALSFSLTALVLMAAASSVFGWFPLTGQTDYVAVRYALPPVVRVPPSSVREAGPVEFTIKVTPWDVPTDGVKRLPRPLDIAEFSATVVHYVNAPPPGSPPAITGNPFPGFLGREIPMLRTLRPGDLVSQEEIEQIRAAAGPLREISILQDSDGRIQRIEMRTRTRRSFDESDIVPFDVHPGPVDASATTATGTDRID